MIGYNSKQKGFTLLLSVLVSSIILSIGIAIFNITFKEIKLSSAGRESQFAFYAADSGAECALFHERKNNVFATSTISNFNISCNAEEHEVTVINDPIGGVYTRTFSMELESNRYCSNVTVTKLVGPPFRTTIESRGTNTCNVSDGRRVERAIEVSF